MIRLFLFKELYVINLYLKIYFEKRNQVKTRNREETEINLSPLNSQCFMKELNPLLVPRGLELFSPRINKYTYWYISTSNPRILANTNSGNNHTLNFYCWKQCREKESISEFL